MEVQICGHAINPSDPHSLLTNLGRAVDCLQQIAANTRPDSSGLIATCVFSALLVAVGFLQVLVLKRQADLLYGTLLQTTLASKIASRAYVSVEKLKDFRNFAVGQIPQIDMQVRNSGTTPAFITNMVVMMSYGDHPPEQPAYDAYKGRQRAVAGSETIVLVAAEDAPLTHAQWQAAQPPNGSFFIWGKLQYTDVFNEPHETGFAGRIRINAAGGFSTFVHQAPGYNFQT